MLSFDEDLAGKGPLGGDGLVVVYEAVAPPGAHVRRVEAGDSGDGAKLGELLPQV